MGIRVLTTTCHYIVPRGVVESDTEDACKRLEGIAFSEWLQVIILFHVLYYRNVSCYVLLWHLKER